MLEIRELFSGEVGQRWSAHAGEVKALVCTGGRGLVSGGSDGFVKKWDLETGKEVWSTDVVRIKDVYLVSLLADGRLVVSGAGFPVKVLDGVTGEEVVACHGPEFYSFVTTSLGDLCGSFASGSYDETIWVWACGTVDFSQGRTEKTKNEINRKKPVIMVKVSNEMVFKISLVYLYINHKDRLRRRGSPWEWG